MDTEARIRYLLNEYTIYENSLVLDAQNSRLKELLVRKAMSLPQIKINQANIPLLPVTAFKPPNVLHHQQTFIRMLSSVLFGEPATRTGKWTSDTAFDFQTVGEEECQLQLIQKPGLEGAWFFSHYNTFLDKLEYLIIPYTKFADGEWQKVDVWNLHPKAYRLAKQEFIRQISFARQFNQLHPDHEQTVKLYSQNIILDHVNEFSFFQELTRIMFHVQGSNIVDGVAAEHCWYFQTENKCRCNFLFTFNEAYFHQRGLWVSHKQL